MLCDAFGSRCVRAGRTPLGTTCPSLSSCSLPSVTLRSLSNPRVHPLIWKNPHSGVSTVARLGHRPTPTQVRSSRFRVAAAAPASGSTIDSTATSPVPSLLRLYPVVLPHWPQVVKAWLCSVLAVSSLLWLVPQLGELTALLGSGNLNRLVPKAVLALVFVAVRSISQYWQDAWLWEVALGVTLSLREQVFSRVQDLNLSNDTATGDIAFRLTQEAEDAGDIVFSFLHALVPAVLQLAAMVFRMLSLSPLLTFSTLCVVPAMAVVIAVLGERVREVSKKGQDTMAALSAYINELLPAMLIVKVHGAQPFEAARFHVLARADLSARLHRKRLKALFPQAITASYGVAVVVILGVGAWVIRGGHLSPPQMVSFLTSLVLLVEPVQAVGSAWNEVKGGEAAVDRLLEVSDREAEVKDAKGAVDLDPSLVRGSIDVEGVRFRYGLPGTAWAVDGVSLEVKAGETVALVGPSGGGKTSMLSLLLRLHDPQQGRILLDGCDLRHATLRSLRQAIGYVPQETLLFSGTVSDNVAYGVRSEEVDMGAVERACRLANAHGFISELPQGYESQVGFRAASLSGGQRQRLAIARAIYHSPKILLLDEATSALDNQSEETVREALTKLMQDRTVIVVAHKLDTIRNADRVVYIDGGKVLEVGTHSELMARRSRYRALYNKEIDIDTQQRLSNVGGGSCIS